MYVSLMSISYFDGSEVHPCASLTAGVEPMAGIVNQHTASDHTTCALHGGIAATIARTHAEVPVLRSLEVRVWHYTSLPLAGLM